MPHTHLQRIDRHIRTKRRPFLPGIHVIFPGLDGNRILEGDRDQSQIKPQRKSGQGKPIGSASGASSRNLQNWKQHKASTMLLPTPEINFVLKNILNLIQCNTKKRSNLTTNSDLEDN